MDRRRMVKRLLLLPAGVAVAAVVPRDKDEELREWREAFREAASKALAEAHLRSHNLALYGTSHPEYGTGPIVGIDLASGPDRSVAVQYDDQGRIVDWTAPKPRVREGLPPIRWRKLNA